MPRLAAAFVLALFAILLPAAPATAEGSDIDITNASFTRSGNMVNFTFTSAPKNASEGWIFFLGSADVSIGLDSNTEVLGSQHIIAAGIYSATLTVPASGQYLLGFATTSGEGPDGKWSGPHEVGTTEPHVTPSGGVTVYRFWSQNAQSHFYTASLAERDEIIRIYSINQWRYEGAVYTAFQTSQPGTVPLYRFWSQQYQGHFYTTDTTERDAVIANYADSEWLYENVAFYVVPTWSDIAPTLPVARFWSQQNRHHFYTASASEAQFVKDNYPDNVWAFEGDNFRVPAVDPSSVSFPNNKDCGNFSNWYEANAWFQYYYPTYGDVAELDADDDLNPCESLFGAP